MACTDVTRGGKQNIDTSFCHMTETKYHKKIQEISHRDVNEIE